MHLPLGPFGAAQFRPPPALSPLPRATRTTSKLPTDRQNRNTALIAFDTERNSRICGCGGYGDALPNPLSVVGFGPRLRGLGSRPGSAARRSRGGRSERAADRFRAAQRRHRLGRGGRVDQVAEPAVASLEHRRDGHEAVVTSHQMGADARPAPVLRAGRQPRSHWVQCDIARGGREVILVDDHRSVAGLKHTVTTAVITARDKNKPRSFRSGALRIARRSDDHQLRVTSKRPWNPSPRP